jgi:hypothetical protein
MRAVIISMERVEEHSIGLVLDLGRIRMNV